MASNRNDSVGGPAVEHTIDIDGDLTDVWETLTDGTALADWLGTPAEFEMRPGAGGRITDDDGTARDLLVTDVDDRSRLAWHWWSEDGRLSTVEITTTAIPSGTRVRVVESLDATLPGSTTTTISASTAVSGVRACRAAAGGRIHSWQAAGSDSWTVRLVRLRATCHRSATCAVANVSAG